MGHLLRSRAGGGYLGHAEEARQLLDASRRAYGSLPETGARRDGPEMLGPLTCKELEVLQLLAEGYSNPAFTEMLSVSDSTVRTALCVPTCATST